MTRCSWCGSDPLYVAYHDTDWGRPERDPRALWEKLILDGFQAGPFLDHHPAQASEFPGGLPRLPPRGHRHLGETEVTRLLADPGIVRHRGKIEGTIRNAQAYLRIEADTGFSPFLWSFVGGSPIQTRRASMAEVPTETPESRAMSKALKKHGFTFCGPTITYAFMQAVGMVNDHMVGCPSHAECLAMA